MARSALFVLLIECVAFAQATPKSSSASAVIDGSLTTILAAQQDPRDGTTYTVVPLYELVTLSVGNIHARYLDELRIQVSGWGELALGDPREGFAGGDLDVGFVEARLFGDRLEARLGRQLVFSGGARALQLDGGSLTWRIWRGLSLTVFGGAPVTRRFATKLGDVAVGTRLAWRARWNTEAGISFIQVNDAGLIARQDLGADARWQMMRSLSVSGFALLSLVELRLAEADAAVSWRPISMLDLRADYRRTSPDLFLPRNSILSVFAQETRDEAGGSFDLHPIARVRIDGDYHVILDDAGTGHDGGLAARVHLGRAFETSIGAEARVLHEWDKGYVRARVFVVERMLPTVTFTLDADAYRLEQPINGDTFSFTGAATVGWDFHPGWRALVSAVGDVTPFVQERFECMAKLVYNYSFRVHEVQR